MRIALRTVLLLAMASFTLMLAAGTASAQETEVEFVDEETGLPCNPCTGEGQGESHMTALPSGVIVSTCSDILQTTKYHNGSGEIEWIGEAHGAPGCNLTNCTVGDEPHWSTSSPGELGSGTGHMTTRICLRNPGSGAELHCDIEIVGEGSGSHEGTYSFAQLCAGGTRRIEGAGGGIAADIEAVHLSE